MTDLISFLTSEELMVVYTIAFFGGILCLVLYVAEKTYNRRNQKNNTRELNLLIEEMEEKLAVVNTIEKEEEPSVSAVSLEKVETKEVSPIIEVQKEEHQDNMVVEEIKYEDIEPDKTSAQAELEKLTESLLNGASDEIENIELTEFETEQEENAIISLDELMEKGNMLYEQNEVTQYKDEGNEPISIQDLEEIMKKGKVLEIDAKEENKIPVIKEEVSHPTVEISENVVSLNYEKAYQGNRDFKSSPIISPIYGIEKGKQNELELENTATFPKFDEEMRKTNEFIVTLKELQKKLD